MSINSQLLNNSSKLALTDAACKLAQNSGAMSTVKLRIKAWNNEKQICCLYLECEDCHSRVHQCSFLSTLNLAFSCAPVAFIIGCFVLRLLLRKESQRAGVQAWAECKVTAIKQDLFRSLKWKKTRLWVLIQFPLLFFFSCIMWSLKQHIVQVLH